VDPGASEEELRRAHRRVREVYGLESMAGCGLYSEPHLRALQDRIQEANDTLMDPERRHRYDVELFPGGEPRLRGGTPILGVPPPLRPGDSLLPVPAVEAEPLVGPETEFTGDLLRRIRESRGISIDDIAQRTKIGARHLQNIELERWESLPAPVYVRGFVSEMAKFLRLDATRGVTSYLRRLSTGESEAAGGAIK
jgi:flagellar biosynthesis protein FlhG